MLYMIISVWENEIGVQLLEKHQVLVRGDIQGAFHKWIQIGYIFCLFVAI